MNIPFGFQGVLIKVNSKKKYISLIKPASKFHLDLEVFKFLSFFLNIYLTNLSEAF